MSDLKKRQEEFREERAECFAENWARPSPEKVERDALSYTHAMGFDSFRSSPEYLAMKEALHGIIRDDINGHNFDELMEDTKKFIIDNGGFQNAYAISHVTDSRDKVRKVLKAIEENK